MERAEAALTPGEWVMLDSADTTALNNVASETGDRELLKLAFKPNLVCSLCKNARTSSLNFFLLHPAPLRKLFQTSRICNRDK